MISFLNKSLYKIINSFVQNDTMFCTRYNKCYSRKNKYHLENPKISAGLIKLNYAGSR